MPGEISSLITGESISSLAGAAGATWVVSSTAQHVFNFNPKWLALLVAAIIASILSYIGMPNVIDVTKILLTPINACLIYLTAVGLNTVVSPTGARARRPVDPSNGHSPGVAQAAMSHSSRNFRTGWY